MKILLINIKFLGDLIVSTPGIRALRKHEPDAQIVFLLRKGYEDVLANNPYIDEIISFDAGMKGNAGISKIIDGIKFIWKLRNEKFDVVISLHPGDRTAFWAWFSGAKIRIAPVKQSFGFLFNRRVNVYEDSISYLDYYNNIIAEYTGRIKNNKTDFFTTAEEENWTGHFFHENKITSVCKVIAIHPGASEPTKIWPAGNFVELIRSLNKHKEIKIILIEGPQDKFVCENILSLFAKNDIINFFSTNISKTCALLKRCKLLITHDTGTRHLAVAVGTPVLALVPKDNLKSWNFYNDISSYYFMTGERFIDGKTNQPTGYLAGISVEEVYNKAAGILQL